MIDGIVLEEGTSLSDLWFLTADGTKRSLTTEELEVIDKGGDLPRDLFLGPLISNAEDFTCIDVEDQKIDQAELEKVTEERIKRLDKISSSPELNKFKMKELRELMSLVYSQAEEGRHILFDAYTHFLLAIGFSKEDACDFANDVDVYCKHTLYDKVDIALLELLLEIRERERRQHKALTKTWN